MKASGPARAAVPVLAAAIAGASLGIETAVADVFSDAVNQLEFAYLTEDRNGLLQARGIFRDIASDPARASISEYYVAYASYRLAQLGADAGKDVMTGYINDCIDSANQAQADNKAFADAIALESACHGMKASAEPLTAVVYGPMSLREMGKARKLAPENPRVLLLEGIGVYSRPGIFGGGIDKAQGIIEQSIRAFDSADPDPVGPGWGQAEAQAFLGEIYFKQDKILDARDALEQALIVAPEYAWARRRLDTVLAVISQGESKND